ncbi:MAG TPA: fused MFS/spermidine synthase [Candidatus Sulfotelmatobacter sp.]
MQHPQRVTLHRVLHGIAVIAFSVGCFSSLTFADNGQTLILKRESLYNNIYVYRNGIYVSLTFGYNRSLYTESVCNTWDELELPARYTQFMTVGLAYPSSVRSILEIGSGGGRTSWYLHKTLPNASITTVELDPAVMEIAKKYFGIREESDFHVANDDGRLFLRKTSERFDLILLDAYRGPFVPFHLLTKEFYEVVKQHLRPGGVVIQNVEPTTMLFDSAVNTIRAVFPNVEFFPADGNIVTVAYSGPERESSALKARARERDDAIRPRYKLEQLLSVRQTYASVEQSIDHNAKVLTDDFAPVEYLRAVEKHNRKWPNATP